MLKNIKISVICSVYRSRYLQTMLDSIFKQTFKSYAVCLRIDGPTDSEIKKIKATIAKYPKNKITTIYGINIGIDNSRRILIDQIKTPYFFIIDDDDYIHPQCLEKLYTEITKSPNIGIAQGAIQTFGLIEQRIKPQKRKKIDGLTVDILSANQPYLINKKFYDMTSGWNADPAVNNAGADNDIFLKIEELAEIKYLDQVLYCRRIHNHNESLAFIEPGSQSPKHTLKLLHTQIQERYLPLEIIKIINHRNNNSAWEIIEIVFKNSKNGKVKKAKTKIFNFSRRYPYQQKELISLQCPAHKLDYLPEMIESIIKQTMDNWELLICFDNPIDKKTMHKIIKNYHNNPKIKFFISSKKRGPGPSRQFLLEKTEAQYIIPIDADDLAAPNLIEEFTKTINSRVHFSILRGGMKLFSNIRSIIVWPKPRIQFKGLTLDIYNCHQPYLINTYYLWKSGGWEWDKNYNNSGEDTDLFLRLEMYAPILLIQKILYYKRVHSKALTQTTASPYSHLQFMLNKQMIIKKQNYKIGEIKSCYLDDITQQFEIIYKNTAFNLLTRFNINTILPISFFIKSGFEIKSKTILELLPRKYLGKLFLYTDLTRDKLICRPNAREILLNEKMPQNIKKRLFRLFLELPVFNKNCFLFESVDIILPVYNNYEITRRCICSIFKQTKSLFNLIIVDDCSTDNKLLKYYRRLQNIKNIKIIFNQKNSGYAISCNNGLSISSSKFAVVMNNDVLLPPNWLYNLLQGFLLSPDIGLIAPAIYKNKPGLDITEIINIFKTASDNQSVKVFAKADFLFGFCLVIRRTAREICGGLNPIFGNPSYYDDIDLSFRFRHNGYQLLLANDVEIYHQGMKSNKEKFPDILKNLYYNFNIFQAIWSGHKFFDKLPAGLIFPNKTINKKQPINIAEQKQNKKIKIAVFNIDSPDNISHKITDLDNLHYLKEYFEIILISRNSFNKSIIDFFNFLTTEKINFIFLNTTFDPLPLFKYRNDHNLPIGFIVWPYIFEPWKNRYQKLAAEAKTQDTFLCFSKYLEKSFQQISTNFNLFKMPVLIDPAVFPDNCSKSTPLTIAYCGRLTPEKNLHIILALLGASKNKLNFKINIICPLVDLNPGEKKYLNQLHKIIRRFKITAETIFHGSLDQDQNKRNKILAESQVLLFISNDPGETFGRAIVEGMAAGCAVITTNWQAVNELITDGENGFKIDIVNKTPNVKQLLAALIILQDPKLRLLIAKLNQKKAKQYDYRLYLPLLAKHLLEINLEEEGISSPKQNIEISNFKNELIAYTKEHKLELAIQLKSLKQLANIDYTEFQYLYFGSEFCEKLIPTIKEIKEILIFCSDKNIKPVVLTPFLTNQGLNKIKKILPAFPPGTEIVFNDWGLINLLQKYNLKPRMGRLLLKIKREPREQNKKNINILEYLRSANIGEKTFQDYLIASHINQLELDNVWQGHNAKLPPNFSCSLWLPYVYITSSYKCLLAENYNMSNCQNKNCQKEFLKADLRKSPGKIWINGNTQFYINTNLPTSEQIENLHIKRIVYSPGLEQPF